MCHFCFVWNQPRFLSISLGFHPGKRSCHERGQAATFSLKWSSSEICHFWPHVLWQWAANSWIRVSIADGFLECRDKIWPGSQLWTPHKDTAGVGAAYLMLLVISLRGSQPNPRNWKSSPPPATYSLGPRIGGRHSSSKTLHRRRAWHTTQQNLFLNAENSTHGGMPPKIYPVKK
jgi:hypothetical protein